MPGIAPLVGAIAPAVIGGVLGKKKVKAPDYSSLRPTIEAGASRERQIAGGLTQKMSPLTQAFESRRGTLAGDLKSDVASRGRDFMQTQETLGERGAANLSGALRQNVLAAQPEIQRQVRESVAASGGLQRGIAPVMAARAAQTAAEQIGQGEAAIQQQKLQGLQNAAQQVFGADINAVTQATGLDADTLQTLLNSGREDLIREAQSLIETERNRIGALTGIQQAQMTSDLAASTANAQGRNQLIQALIQGGGQALGSYFGQRTPTAAAAVRG